MYHFTLEDIRNYVNHLQATEHSTATIEKYAHSLERFLTWTEGSVDKGKVIGFKEYLSGELAPTTVNAELAAVNGFLKFQGWHDCVVKVLKIQRAAFCSENRELTKEEYQALVDTAKRTGKVALALILETFGSTGMRVSELQYFVVDSLNYGKIRIDSKGKFRDVIVNDKLGEKVRKFIKEKGIKTGAIFQGKDGKPLSRKTIWAQMKQLAIEAGVDPEKVFPHNIRHLFAREFYKKEKDIVKLADILGHSSINTTRLYLISTGKEHKRMLDGLGMVS